MCFGQAIVIIAGQSNERIRGKFASQVGNYRIRPCRTVRSLHRQREYVFSIGGLPSTAITECRNDDHVLGPIGVPVCQLQIHASIGRCGLVLAEIEIVLTAFKIRLWPLRHYFRNLCESSGRFLVSTKTMIPTGQVQMAIDKTWIETHSPLYRLNTLFMLAQAKLRDSQTVQSVNIGWIKTQTLLKSFSRFRKASSRAVCHAQIHVSREVGRIECGSLFVSANRFRVAAH